MSSVSPGTHGVIGRRGPISDTGRGVNHGTDRAGAHVGTLTISGTTTRRPTRINNTLLPIFDTVVSPDLDLIMTRQVAGGPIVPLPRAPDPYSLNVDLHRLSGEEGGMCTASPQSITHRTAVRRPTARAFLDQAHDLLADTPSAATILSRVTPSTRKINTSFNCLGPSGARVLFDGLRAYRKAQNQGRRQFCLCTAQAKSTSEEEGFVPEWPEDGASAVPHVPTEEELKRTETDVDIWGLREIRLRRNGLGDDGLLTVLRYVAEDKTTRVLDVEDNEIKVGIALPDDPLTPQLLDSTYELAVELLNASNLTELYLSYNFLSTPGAIHFFKNLRIPLRILTFDECAIPVPCAPALAGYLASARGQRLENLDIFNNDLRVAGLQDIIAAVEEGNYALVVNCIDGNCPRSQADLERGLSRRMTAAVVRNYALRERVRNAAKRVIMPLRLIAHAKRPPVTGKRKRDDGEEAADSASPHPTEPHFPLLDLPRELQLLVGRHCSQDAEAFSEAQWLRVLAHALDPTSLSRRAERAGVAERCGGLRSSKSWVTKGTMVEEWREEVGCVAWELNQPAEAWQRNQKQDDET